MRTRRPIPILGTWVLALGLVLGASRARADWPSDPTVNVPLRATSVSEAPVAIVSDGAGGAIVAIEVRSLGAHGLFAQRVDAAGAVRWTSVGATVCAAAANQFDTQLAEDGAGGAFFVWQDDRTGEIRLRAQHVTRDGSLLWDADGIQVATTVGEQAMPALVADGEGGVIVAWRDGRDGAVTHLYAQRLDANGTARWAADGVRVIEEPFDWDRPALVSDGAAGALVLVGVVDPDSGHLRIHAQRIAADGALRWTNGPVWADEDATGACSPIAVGDGWGGAIAFWLVPVPYLFDTYVLRAQAIDSTGTRRWGPTDPAVVSSDQGVYAFTAVPSTPGSAIVVWYGRATTALRAQRLDPSGARAWGDLGAVVRDSTAQNRWPAATPDGAGGVLVPWDDARSPGFDVRAQHIGLDGSPRWALDGIAVSTAPHAQFDSRLCPDGAGGAIVTWADDRVDPLSGQLDIYAQNVRADGSLGGSLLAVPDPQRTPALRWIDVGPVPGPFVRTVVFALPEDSDASLELFDASGRRVAGATLAGAGVHRITIGADARHPAPGVYLLQLRQGAHRALKRIVVLG